MLQAPPGLLFPLLAGLQASSQASAAGAYTHTGTKDPWQLLTP
ncbi:MAG: hypothetical protein ACOY5B_14460 [Spirochaetota bacterium]